MYIIYIIYIPTISHLNFIACSKLTCIYTYIHCKLISYTSSHFLHLYIVASSFIRKRTLLPDFIRIFRIEKWTRVDVMMLVPNLREQ